MIGRLGALAFCAVSHGAVAQNVSSICLASGTPAEGYVADIDHADGRHVGIITWPGDPGETHLVRVQFQEPALPFLWRLAEPVLAEMPEIEAQPCAARPVRTLVVTFTDGATARSEASCDGSLLHQMAADILRDAPDPDEEPRPVRTRYDGILDGAADACGRIW